MSRREKLQERYEDAWFALLMDGVAEHEIQELENRRQTLEDDPAAAVPEALERRCQQSIRRHFAGQRRAVHRKTAKRVLNRAAIVAAVAALLLTTALAMSEDVRVAAMNLLIRVEEQYTALMLHPDGAQPPEVDTPPEEPAVENHEYFRDWEIGWIPEGYVLNESIGRYDSLSLFENSEGDWFSVSIDDVKPPERSSSSSTYFLNVDTENAESVENITINGNEGLCVVKNGQVSIAVADLEHFAYISVHAAPGVPVEGVRRIAENVRYHPSTSDEYFEDLYMDYIPEGFSLLNCNYNGSVEFQNEAGAYINIYKALEDSNWDFLQENSDRVKEIAVNGSPGVRLYKEDAMYTILRGFTMDDGAQEIVIVIYTEHVSEDIHVKIVENLRYTGF